MEILFTVNTPLDIEVRTTLTYWEYLIMIKHQIMKGKVHLVIETLRNPDEIRRSSIDESVFLYYKKEDKLYCVIARHIGKEGFLITAYPTDKVKEGELIWTK